MNKKLFAILLCGILVCANVSIVCASGCFHENTDVLEEWDGMIVSAEGHEHVTYQNVHCYDCGRDILDVLYSAHLEAHSYGRPKLEHDYDNNEDIVTYTCDICHYKAVRRVPCGGPPCTIIYWSLRP